HLVEDRPGAGHRGGGQAAGVEQFAGPHQAQIAEQDRGGGPEPVRVTVPAVLAVQRREPAVYRRLAPPGVGAVHHVVVDEGAGLYQFQPGHGGHQGVTVLTSRTAAPPVGEGGPETLPTGQDEPRHHVQEPVDAGLVGGRGGVVDGIVREVVGDGGRQRRDDT